MHMHLISQTPTSLVYIYVAHPLVLMSHFRKFEHQEMTNEV